LSSSSSAPQAFTTLSSSSSAPQASTTLSTSSSAPQAFTTSSICALQTGFTNNLHLASIFDTSVMQVIVQDTLSISNSTNPVRIRHWIFEHKYMLQNLILEKGGKNEICMIVSFAKLTANEGDLFQVHFNL
jgi:hypothetical protein